jgi:hypothetical protein
MSMPKRACMLCRTDHYKGFFRHRTDPICIDGVAAIREQRRLLNVKYRREQTEYQPTTADKKYADKVFNDD